MRQMDLAYGLPQTYSRYEVFASEVRAEMAILIGYLVVFRTLKVRAGRVV